MDSHYLPQSDPALGTGQQLYQRAEHAPRVELLPHEAKDHFDIFQIVGHQAELVRVSGIKSSRR